MKGALRINLFTVCEWLVEFPERESDGLFKRPITQERRQG